MGLIESSLFLYYLDERARERERKRESLGDIHVPSLMEQDPRLKSPKYYLDQSKLIVSGDCLIPTERIVQVRAAQRLENIRNIRMERRFKNGSVILGLTILTLSGIENICQKVIKENKIISTMDHR